MKTKTKTNSSQTQVAAETPALLTRRQAARQLNLSHRTLEHWTSQKKIKFIRVGGQVRFRQADLNAYLDARTVQPINQTQTAIQ